MSGRGKRAALSSTSMRSGLSESVGCGERIRLATISTYVEAAGRQ